MKFSLYLNHQMVPEWKEYYIRFDLFNDALLTAFNRGGSPAKLVIEVPAAEPTELLRVHSEPTVVEMGVMRERKEAEETAKLELEQQLTKGEKEFGLLDERKLLSEADLEAQVKGKEVQPIADSFDMKDVIPSLLPFHLKDIVEKAERRASLANTFHEEFDYNAVPEGSRNFFRSLNEDVKKATDFFLDQQFSFEKSFGELSDNVTQAEEMADSILREREIRLLRHNFKELFKNLKFLRNFAILNTAAVSNLMHMYDSYCGTNFTDMVMKGINENQVLSYDHIDELTSKVEEVYLRLTVVQRTVTRHSPFLPDIPKTFHNVAFRNGWYLGLILPALVIMIYLAVTNPARLQDISFIRITRVYAGYAILMIYLWGLGFNQAIWSHFRINYIYILELDPGNHIEIPHYFELISGMSVLVAYSYLLYFWEITVGDFHVDYHPLLLSAILLFILLFPLNIYYRSTRYWMVNGLLRLLVAPLIKVTFRDFISADQFCSMVYILISVQYMFCVYFPNNDSPFLCNQRTGWLTLLLAMLPSFIRFLQCLRRYYDLRSRSHLVNAAKYLSAMLVSVFALLARVYDDSTALYTVWIVVAILSAIYSFVWDTLRDWGLFEADSKNRFLRKSLVYPSPWIYYIAVPLNFGLRCAWIVTLSENPANPTIRDFVLAACEIYRRLQWNVFRMELEHVSNYEKFRSCRHVPVSFHHEAVPQHYRSILCQ